MCKFSKAHWHSHRTLSLCLRSFSVCHPILYISYMDFSDTSQTPACTRPSGWTWLAWTHRHLAWRLGYGDEFHLYPWLYPWLLLALGSLMAAELSQDKSTLRHHPCGFWRSHRGQRGLDVPNNHCGPTAGTYSVSKSGGGGIEDHFNPLPCLLSPPSLSQLSLLPLRPVSLSPSPSSLPMQ